MRLMFYCVCLFPLIFKLPISSNLDMIFKHLTTPVICIVFGKILCLQISKNTILICKLDKHFGVYEVAPCSGKVHWRSLRISSSSLPSPPRPLIEKAFFPKICRESQGRTFLKVLLTLSKSH